MTILGPDGLPFSPSAAGYYGASTMAPELRDWLPSAGSADADLLPDLDLLRARSRDLVANHGLASSALQTTVDYVLGVGLRLQAMPDYRLLGRDANWAHDWATHVESLWRAYCDGPDHGCDATRTSSMGSLATQTFRGMMANGSAVALVLWQPERRNATTLQLIEADRLSNPLGMPDSTLMRGGIEIDDYGAPVAYHIRKTHPGDLFMGSFGPWGGQWERVPAETAWGRKRVIHCYAKDRAHQSRGVPAFAAVLGEFRTLGEYQRSELQAASVNAMVAGILEAPLDGATISELFGTGEAYVTARGKAPAVRMQRGKVLRTFPGEKFTSFAPGRPNPAFEAFVTTIHRVVAAGLHMPYELVLKDWSKCNYSSARSALLDVWRYFKTRRHLMAEQWYAPIYVLWLEEMVNAGQIEAPSFYDNLYAYSRAIWAGPGLGWVDPLKEAQAADQRLRSGLSTLESEASEQGRNWEDDAEQRAREVRRLKELGLNPQPAPAGMVQSPPPAPSDDGNPPEDN